MSGRIEAARDLATRLHEGQVRKGAERYPYILHCREVATFTELHGGDEVAVCAAWLHDTVEDCPPFSLEAIASEFGPEVARVVGELTDDKSLPSKARKALQIENGPKKSAAACLVKLGDKTSNCRSIATAPPVGWPLERRVAYLDWSERVVAALAHRPATALEEFDVTLRAARLRLGV
ncbi:MAG: HD domain-containing protein [Pseudomonadota bacterium]